MRVEHDASGFLNEAQRRSLSAIIAALEKALFDFEGWASGQERQGRVYQEVNDLTPSQREALHHYVARLRESIADAVLTFRLEPQVREVRASIRGRAAILWEGVADTEPRRLERYGPVHPDAESLLSPRTSALIAILEKILSLVGQT